jgi:hypothetical protein
MEGIADNTSRWRHGFFVNSPLKQTVLLHLYWKISVELHTRSSYAVRVKTTWRTVTVPLQKRTSNCDGFPLVASIFVPCWRLKSLLWFHCASNGELALCKKAVVSRTALHPFPSVTWQHKDSLERKTPLNLVVKYKRIPLWYFYQTQFIHSVQVALTNA